jgi:hypothetical protein
MRRKFWKATLALCIATASVAMSPPGPATAATGAAYCPEVTGSVQRLYNAYFERDPDPQGFDYWLGKYFSGSSLTLISDTFTKSREYQSRYAGLGNGDFVRLVYRNVLDREPDQAGWQYWTDILNRGVLPRGGVMIRFSESPEFVSKTKTATPLVIPPGTFIYCGQGTDVVQIATPGGGKGAIVHARMHGSGNNIIWSRDGAGARNDLVVNEIGPYQGANLIDLSPMDSLSRSLEITSRASWVVQVRPLASAQRFTGAVSGGGDDVLYYAGGRTVGRFTHTGSSNFIVQAVTSSDWDLLVNEIGSYDGRTPVDLAPAFISVNADGGWRVSIPG